MTSRKRALLEPTDDWEQLQFQLDWPEQTRYELIRPVAGRCEKASAQQTCPECVCSRKEIHAEAEIEIEDPEFSGRSRHRGYVRPAPWNIVQENEKTNDRADDIEHHLNHVGPDYGGHAAFERIKQC